MSHPDLDCPGIVAGVGQRAAAAMAQHVSPGKPIQPAKYSSESSQKGAFLGHFWSFASMWISLQNASDFGISMVESDT